LPYEIEKISMNSTESSLTAAIILRIGSQFSIYTGFITFSAAIVGNIINILIFTHLKFFRTNRCIFYLIIESISDLIYQFVSIISTIFILLYEQDLTSVSLIWCRLKIFLSQSCALTTFSMICFAAADQFFSTDYRLHLRQICTMKLARYLVFISTALWLTHSIVFSFWVNIVPSVGCIISNPILVRYATFFFYPVLVGLLPMVIASLFSLLAYRNVRRIVRRQLSIERRRFDRQITAMVLLRAVFSVCFTLPFLIYRIYVINVTVTQANPLKFAIVQLVFAIIVSILNLKYTVRYFCVIHIEYIDLF